MGLLSATGRSTKSDTSRSINTTDAACLTSAPLPTCTTSTLTTDSSGTAASASTWVWADNLHLSPGAQSTLGSLAVTRAQNNPF